MEFITVREMSIDRKSLTHLYILQLISGVNHIVRFAGLGNPTSAVPNAEGTHDPWRFIIHSTGEELVIVHHEILSLECIVPK